MALGVAVGSTGAGVLVVNGGALVVAAGGVVALSVATGAAGSSVRLQAHPKTSQENVAMRRLGLRCMMIGVLEPQTVCWGNEMHEA